MPIKLALPKGRLLSETAALFHNAGWELSGYHQAARFFRPKSKKFPDVIIKVFQERDSLVGQTIQMRVVPGFLSFLILRHKQ